MTFRAELEEGEEITFLTLDEVEEIHEACLTPGNLTGYLKVGDLESALGRPKAHHVYKEQYDLIELAAVLWHGISVAHGFKDGNKRAGLASAFAFLEANGIEADPTVPSREPGEFTEACFQQGRFEVPVLAHYLRTRCRWITEE